jgi:hypothetical protein
MPYNHGYTLWINDQSFDLSPKEITTNANINYIIPNQKDNGEIVERK